MLLVLSTMAVAGVGCNVFSTREPEEPDAGRGCWVIPQSLSGVLENLTCTMSEGIESDYMLAFFADSLEFVADNVALAVDPSLSPWGYSDEQSFARNLFSQNLSVFVNFELQDSSIADTAFVFASYQIVINPAPQSLPETIAGTARFDFRIGHAGFWQIYRWTDLRTEEANTWSDLKSLMH